jgi:hypothetical protein
MKSTVEECDANETSRRRCLNVECQMLTLGYGPTSVPAIRCARTSGNSLFTLSASQEGFVMQVDCDFASRLIRIEEFLCVHSAVLVKSTRIYERGQKTTKVHEYQIIGATIQLAR